MTERGIQAGQELPALEIRVTRSVVVRYAGAPTDFNEIHFSNRHAHAIGLPRVLTHGMWTMGAGLGLITHWIGDPARIGRYYIRFTRPVVVPGTGKGMPVRLTGTVATVADEMTTVNLTTTCGGDAVLGAAKAEMRID